ncbi:MAG: class I SAM-dependent RNA methyltransferase [Elusimicrobiota bacterium]
MLKITPVCAPGLEPFLRQELRALALGQGLRDVYRANLHLRTAERVLVRVGEFHAAAFPELERKAKRLPWGSFLAPGRSVAVRASCRRSRLYHERAVAERVERAASSGDAGSPQLVFVRMEDDLCTVDIDSSGEPLHRRGYRLATAKAPLSETLASALVMACGWDAASPLLDPFCGSGTIPIEAALLAGRLPPGRSRRFAFMDWPGFDMGSWQALLAETDAQFSAPRIIASDRDAGAVRSAQANAERAGVADRIEFSCGAVSAVEPPASPGWVLTNPPYGVRLKGKGDLRDLYAQFGKVLRGRLPGWRVAMLCPSVPLIRSTGLRLEPRLEAISGGLKVRLWTGGPL